MRVLVTGGSGFIGYHVACGFRQLGEDVTIISDGAGNRPPGVKTLYSTVMGTPPELLTGFDAVVHLAANNDTRDGDSHEMTRVNVGDPIRLFRCAWEGGCRRFVYASSTAVYGNLPAPFREDAALPPSLPPYAASKKFLELATADYLSHRDGHGIGLRFCNVYGPGELHKGKRASMVGQLIAQCLADRSPRLFRDGEQRRDWLHVEDAARAVIAAVYACDRVRHEVVNVGAGTAVSFRELVRLIYEADPRIDWVECPFGDRYQTHTCCDISKAAVILNWRPRRNLADGIRSYREWLKGRPFFQTALTGSATD